MSQAQAESWTCQHCGGINRHVEGCRELESMILHCGNCRKRLPRGTGLICDECRAAYPIGTADPSMPQEDRLQLMLGVQRPEARRQVEEIIRSMLAEAYKAGHEDGLSNFRRRRNYPAPQITLPKGEEVGDLTFTAEQYGKKLEKAIAETIKSGDIQVMKPGLRYEPLDQDDEVQTIIQRHIMQAIERGNAALLTDGCRRCKTPAPTLDTARSTEELRKWQLIIGPGDGSQRFLLCQRCNAMCFRDGKLDTALLHNEPVTPRCNCHHPEGGHLPGCGQYAETKHTHCADCELPIPPQGHLTASDPMWCVIREPSGEEYLLCENCQKCRWERMGRLTKSDPWIWMREQRKAEQQVAASGTTLSLQEQNDIRRLSEQCERETGYPLRHAIGAAAEEAQKIFDEENMGAFTFPGQDPALPKTIEVNHVDPDFEATLQAQKEFIASLKDDTEDQPLIVQKRP